MNRKEDVPIMSGAESSIVCSLINPADPERNATDIRIEMNDNDDVDTPRKKDSACERIESSRSVTSSRYRKPPNTAASNQHVSFVKARSRTTYELPLIYYVDRKDRMPRLAENFPNNQINSLRTHADKSRLRFLASRKEKRLKREEERKHVKDLGSAIGLKVEPIKTLSVPSRGCSSKQPTTPFFSMSEKSELKSHDTSFFNSEGLLADDKSVTTAASEKRVTPIEIPGAFEANSRTGTPESSASKKVRFAKKSAKSKNRSIQLPKVDQSADEFQEIVLRKNSATPELKPEPNPQPQKVKTTTPPRNKRDANLLSLPKIDMITPIYDELILKTFQTFMTSKNPMTDKNARAILQRVSAVLHPMEDLQLDRRTPVSRPRTRETSFFSTEPLDESIDLEFPDVSPSITVDGKSMSMMMRDVESRQKRAQVHSTCFQMPPPGLDRGETLQSIMSGKKHTIYIPSTC